MDSQTSKRTVVIKSIDEDKQVVYGEVYAPNMLDSYGDMMLAEDIELMAHEFISRSDTDSMFDVNHDNVSITAKPVESFIARKGDADYTEGAWVLGVKIDDVDVWASIRGGDLNGFSMESLVIKKRAIAIVETIIDNVGVTEESCDHVHTFYVELDENGLVVKGITSKAGDGHFHDISRGTATDDANDHSHRYFTQC